METAAAAIAANIQFFVGQFLMAGAAVMMVLGLRLQILRQLASHVVLFATAGIFWTTKSQTIQLFFPDSVYTSIVNHVCLLSLPGLIFLVGGYYLGDGHRNIIRRMWQINLILAALAVAAYLPVANYRQTIMDLVPSWAFLCAAVGSGYLGYRILKGDRSALLVTVAVTSIAGAALVDFAWEGWRIL